MTKVPYKDLSESKKKRWFGEERNARRRLRYAQDQAYRERVLDQAKRSRSAIRRDSKLLKKMECRDVKTFSQSKLLHVKEAGLATYCPDVISRRDLVMFLNISNMTLSRWINKSILPAPALFEVGKLFSHDNRYGYYALAELKPLISLCQSSDACTDTRSLSLLAEQKSLYSMILRERDSYIRKVFK